MAKRSVSVLIAGFSLILLGALFLASNLTDFSMDWIFLAKLVIPLLLILAGGMKLFRHYRWPAEELAAKPGKSSLFGGLFWLFLGSVLFLDLVGALETLPFIGTFWPIILITFGLGKIIDYYRLGNRINLRVGEVFGVVFLIVFGLTSAQLARTHASLLDWNLGSFELPVPPELEKKRFRYEAEELIPLEQVERVRIENLYGDVEVRATEPGAEPRVSLMKTIRAESREEAEENDLKVKLLFTQSESLLTITTNRKALGTIGKNVTTDLRVELPIDLPLDVHNGFGDVTVTARNRDCTIVNSYGRIQMSSIRGSVEATNRYEPISLSEIEGSVKANNRRGSIELKEIDGPVSAETDYETIVTENVVGSVALANHFGSLRVRNIEGVVTINGTGSRVDLQGVAQSATVFSSHKPVAIKQVGSLTLETSYADIDLREIEGPVSLKAAQSDVDARTLRGGITVQGRGSEINLRNISGTTRVETSLKKVRVADFRGSVSIQNEFGEVELEAPDELAGAIHVANKNGSILVILPEKARCRISAQAVQGNISSDFGPEPKRSEGDVAFLEAVLGEGGPEIELQTTYARIQIRKRG